MEIDPNSSANPGFIAWVFGVIISTVIGFFSWFGKRHIVRLDKIEREYITRDELKDELRELHEDIKDGFKQVNNRIDHHMINKG